MNVVKRQGRHRASTRRTPVAELVARVQRETGRQPGPRLAVGVDPLTWRPLHGSEAARWHLQPGEQTRRAIAAVGPQQTGGEAT